MNKVLIFTIMISLFSCSSHKDLPTVKSVELEKYTGLWYEIARLPNSFEKGLKCTTAEYEIMKNGKIQVINTGYKIENDSEKKQAKGKAWVPDKSEPGRLKVSFFWPFSGDYYIIHLDENYQYVLVGSPSREYLWILARNKSISQSVKDELIAHAKKYDFNTDNLIWVEQDCNN
jgi:apolipoprotein D and lipocalin family protein